MNTTKKITAEQKKNTIKVKSLNNAEMKIKADDGWTVSATIRYNNHIIHITYYRWLPKYEGWETVKVIRRLLIHEWYYIIDTRNRSNDDEIYNIVEGELLTIFDTLTQWAAMAK